MFTYFIPLTVNFTKNSKLEKFVHELNALWKLSGSSMGAQWELVAVAGIVCDFAFSWIGIAVALRPGDFQLVNPQEPHSTSSRCKAEDGIFCTSSYLNSLTAIDGHDRQYFNKLRSTVVSCRIFIRSQSLIARWTRNDFSSPAVSRDFHEAFLIDDVSRGSKSYLFCAS